jgi:cell division initiation protein
MKLTPHDIQSQEFGIKSKGFDKEEVTSFLTKVSESLENEILENDRLKKELDKMKESLDEFEKRENILRDTLISAQKFSNEIKTNANKEYDLIIKEAEIKSEEIISQAIKRQQDIKEEIRNLKLRRKEIENNILNMLNSLKEIIESYRNVDEEFEKVEYLSK